MKGSTNCARRHATAALAPSCGQAQHALCLFTLPSSWHHVRAHSSANRHEGLLRYLKSGSLRELHFILHADNETPIRSQTTAFGYPMGCMRSR